MALTLEELINNGLLDELADCLNDKTDAELLLRTINFPVGSRPNFDKADNSLDFWFKVCEQIEKGRVLGGFEPLLRAAARRFPGNNVFAPFAQSTRIAAAPRPGQPTQGAPAFPHLSSDFYHCFISYCSRYRDEVKTIDQELRQRAVKPWLDVHDLGLGDPFAHEIEQILSQVKVFLACIGAEDLSSWQKAEVEVAVSNSVAGICTVIPVMLSDTPGPAILPPFLRRLNGIQVKGGLGDAQTLDKLAATILHLNQAPDATRARS
jgi:hypothetical protein